MDDRLHPREVLEHSDSMKKKMDKINQEYLDKMNEKQGN
jgi:hypothetical protein